MIKFNIVSLIPEIIQKPLEYGVMAKALEKNLLSIDYYSPRDFVQTQYKAVDDKPFGGGEGMLLQYRPLKDCLDSIEKPGKVVLLSPQGQIWQNSKAKKWAESKETFTLICGRYEGVDQRFINHYVDEEISIGDYVISGGEMAALVLIDSIMRFLPGALGNDLSAVKDSFSEGLLKAPSFTRPAEDEVLGTVPEVLLSGHHKNIEIWREMVSQVVTHQKRPELIQGKENSIDLPKAYEYVLNLSDKEIEVCGLEPAKVRASYQQLEKRLSQKGQIL